MVCLSHWFVRGGEWWATCLYCCSLHWCSYCQLCHHPLGRLVGYQQMSTILRISFMYKGSVVAFGGFDNWSFMVQDVGKENYCPLSVVVMVFITLVSGWVSTVQFVSLEMRLHFWWITPAKIYKFSKSLCPPSIGDWGFQNTPTCLIWWMAIPKKQISKMLIH